MRKRNTTKKRVGKVELSNNSNSSTSNPFKINWPQIGGKKLVGAYLPIKVADYLHLNALYQKTTVSNIIRSLVMEFIEEQIPEEIMINHLVGQAAEQWEHRFAKNKGESGWCDRIDVLARYREFQQEMRLLLIKRSLSDSFIVRIIKKLEAKQEWL